MNLCLLISPGIKVKHFQTKLYLFLGSQCWLPHPYCKEEEGGGGAVSRRQDHNTHRDAVAAPNMILTKARDWYNVNIIDCKQKCIYLSTQS